MPSACPDGQCHVAPGRNRTQAGLTNRWRLTQPSAGDLLGQSQACRALGPTLQTTASVHTLSRCNVPSRTDPPLLLPDILPPTAPWCLDVHPSPEISFYLVTQEVTQNGRPDAVLECLGSIWELHRPFLFTSETLDKLYSKSKTQRSKPMQERGGTSWTGLSRRHYRASQGEWTLREDREVGTSGGCFRRPVRVHLPVHDPSITKEALSFTLQTLYRPTECPTEWGGPVLSAAALLGLPQLYQRCLNEMMATITSSTVCDFHRVSCEHRQTALQRACERWLELFLVTELSCKIELRKLPFDLLFKTLRSPRVFALNEYDLLTTVLNWIYLLSSSQRTVPSHGTIASFFCRATGVFLEEPRGRTYLPLFQALRLHAIVEQNHIEEMQKINVFPPSWLVLAFSNHVSSIHSGGDMHVSEFSKHSIRFGMIINGELQHNTRAIGLYGFYFLLKASRVGDADAFGFSLERLRHWDPAVAESCRTTQPFSMKTERHVRYQITAQSCVRGQWQEHSSGVISQGFGLSKRCCRSQVFTVDGLSTPLFVTFALIFPSV